MPYGNPPRFAQPYHRRDFDKLWDYAPTDDSGPILSSSVVRALYEGGDGLFVYTEASRLVAEAALADFLGYA